MALMGYPQPQQGPGDINSQVLGIISPQLQAAADGINRRSQMGSAAISGLTSSYSAGMSQLANEGVGFFKPERKLAKGVAGYARDALTGAGQTIGKGYSADLAQAGVRGPGDINLPQIGAGAGGAAYGTGIAELDALIAKQAAAQTEAALEPSFAAGMGQMQQGLLAAQLARQLADQQGQIESQVPGLVDSLTQRQIAAQQDQRDYQQHVLEYNQSRQDAQANARADAANAQAKAAAQAGDKAAATAWKYANTLNQKYPGRVYVPRQQKDGSWRVVEVGQAKTKQPTNTGPYYKDPTSGKWQLKPGYEPGPGGSVVKTPAPVKGPGAKQPTNTGPWFRDPTTGKWQLKPGYEMQGGRVVKTKTAATGSKATGTAPRRRGVGRWVDANGRPLSPAGSAYWERKFQQGFTDGKGRLTPGKPGKGSGGPSSALD
jgi:hypothetical protein